MNNTCRILQYVYLLLCMVVAVTTVGCGKINPLPEDDEQAQASHEQALQPQQQAIIQLEDLNENSDDELWEQFFNQRGGISCWEQIYMTPDNIDKHLEVSFDEFKEASMLIDAQDRTDQVTAGIVHYLACPQKPIESLKIWGHSDHISSKIRSLPTEIAKLGSLKKLDIGFNQFKSFPDVLCYLPSLRVLCLNHNCMSRLPTAITQLTNLKRIDLRNNQIQEFPSILCQMTSLRKLNLGSNSITELPAEIRKLQLKQLFIANNRLTKLPCSLLTYLEDEKLRLSMDDNPWIWMDDDIEASTHLKPIGINELKKAAYARFCSRSLKVICIRCIEKTLQPEQQRGYDQLLPEELQHEKRVQLIRQVYSLEDKSIMFFKSIRDHDDHFMDQIFPFYIDHLPATSENVDSMVEEVEAMLEEAEEGQLCEIVAACPIYTEEQDAEDFVFADREGQPCNNM